MFGHVATRIHLVCAQTVPSPPWWKDVIPWGSGMQSASRLEYTRSTWIYKLFSICAYSPVRFGTVEVKTGFKRRVQTNGGSYQILILVSKGRFIKIMNIYNSA